MPLMREDLNAKAETRRCASAVVFEKAFLGPNPKP